MAKAKSKFVKVLLESIVTKHQVILVKLRTLESLEVLRYDPMLQAPSLYREAIKKLGQGRFLSVSRYRIRMGLPPAPSAEGPLTDDPDWSYPDGRPGLMNKGQTKRYLRDQEMGETMVKFNKQFKAIAEQRRQQTLASSSASSGDTSISN